MFYLLIWIFIISEQKTFFFFLSYSESSYIWATSGEVMAEEGNP